MIAWIIVFIVVAVVCLVLRKRYKEKPQEAKPVSEVVEKPDKTQQQLNSLVSLNLEVREDSNRDEDVMGLVEEIIDSLTSIIPKLNSEHPSSDLTFTVSRVVDEFFPNVVKNYLKLSPEKRESNKGDVTTSLSALKERIQTITNKMESQAETEFDVEAKMLKTLMEH